ncbi:MAG: DUF4255 domain-containing protein [Phycisphaerales bacterium]
MIDVAMKFLADELNVYLRNRTGTDLGQVTLGPAADDSGKWGTKEGSLGLSLIGIEEDRVTRATLPEMVLVQGNHVILQPELRLNLNILFSVRLANYESSLRYLSYVMMFFQHHPSFEQDSFPGLRSDIRKLVVELLSWTPEQASQIWGYLGAKYLPSAAYRVRMVILQDAEPRGTGRPITEIVAETRQR